MLDIFNIKVNFKLVRSRECRFSLFFRFALFLTWISWAVQKNFAALINFEGETKQHWLTCHGMNISFEWNIFFVVPSLHIWMRLKDYLN